MSRIRCLPLLEDLVGGAAGRNFLRLVAITIATLGFAGCLSAVASSSSLREITERAFLAAAAAGETDARCRDTIGKDASLALVRYCREVSSATHPPCNTANHCAL